MLIKPDTLGMHQGHPQEPIAQMPRIARQHPFDLASIGQLPKERIKEIPDPLQDRTLGNCRARRMGFVKRNLQENAFLAQAGLHFRQSVVAIAQNQPQGAFQQRRSGLSIRFIGRSQEHAGNSSRPFQRQMRAKTVKRQVIRMIFPITGLAAKAHAPSHLRKTAHQHWHAANDADQCVVADQFIAQPHLQMPFDCPQIGCLPHRGRVMDSGQTGKEVGVMLVKKDKERFILADSQIRTNHFRCQDLAIREFGHRSSLPKIEMLGQLDHHVVNPTITCDKKVVQIHECPPRSSFCHSSEDNSWAFSFARETCTRR